jgi:hypothetical protein
VTEPTDKLLDLIYDAATERELWVSALMQVADMTNSVGACVFGVEHNARQVVFTFNGGLSDDAHRVYRERHVVNPIANHMNHSPAGKLVQSDDILPLAELKRTPFFDEVFRPQDVAHNAMVPLRSQPTYCADALF